MEASEERTGARAERASRTGEGLGETEQAGASQAASTVSAAEDATVARQHRADTRAPATAVGEGATGAAKVQGQGVEEAAERSENEKERETGTDVVTAEIKMREGDVKLVVRKMRKTEDVAVQPQTHSQAGAAVQQTAAEDNVPSSC